MRDIFNFIYKCHKWFGIPLAIMFIIWYCSGIIMMYHGFPRLSPSLMPVERVDSTELNKLWGEVPESFGMCKLSFSAGRMQIAVNGETLGAFEPDYNDLRAIASSYGTTIERVDTLADLDKWTPFNQLMRHLPFYRIVGDDGTYLYISSSTGEVVQRCTLSERRWAWFGALPHYVYITPIRRDVELWRKVVVWMSGLSTISVIFGIVIALRFLFKRRKLRIFKKRSWQWHYSWGLFFGIFMFTFIFSGMMSLADIPDWIMKSTPLAQEKRTMVDKADVNISNLPTEFGQVILNSTPLMMWQITSDDIKSIRSASSNKLDFSPSNITEIIERQTGEKVESVEKIKDDIFYTTDGIEGYRATTPHFTVYWNEDGYYRVMDKKSKAQFICYRFLHKMQIPGLYNIKWLHELFMWIILLGGIVIVATGTILSIRAIKNRTLQNLF